MIFLQERIGKLLEELKTLIYTDEQPITSYQYAQVEGKSDLRDLAKVKLCPFEGEQLWGGHRAYYLFTTTVEIPSHFAGKTVVYGLTTGREAGWDATNPQFTVYVNGKTRQGFDVNHNEIVLTESAVAGEIFEISLSAFTGDQNFGMYLHSALKVLDRATEHYYYDLVVPFEVAKLLGRDEVPYQTIIQALNESLNLLDLRYPHSDAYVQSLQEAQEYLTREFYEKSCGDSEAVVYCVGHTHIDVAWLWTLAVTEDKAVRSFSTVLELMRNYPEYLFMSSQPQLYEYVKNNAPEVYAEIKERIAEGRWEAEGGMWLEADCNIASGEALVRQILYGTRYFKQEFGKDNKILWLPDVFGYSAALPQILQKFSMPYFMTTKISWNEFNALPYDTFEWEGIDGSKVLTHFIPTRDYMNDAQRAAYSSANTPIHFTTYNGDINPSQVKGGWQRYQQKYLNDTILNSFGYGDGGGGPTSKMLEYQRRLATGIPGCPKTKPATSLEFFEKLEADVKDKKYLPTWVGELYLEYHRGTYTAMARNKRYNRKGEFALQDAELYAALNMGLNGTPYPQSELYEGWKVLLRNQFHDILPGSSIKEVYDDSKVEYEGLLAQTNMLQQAAMQQIADQVDAPQDSVVVFNPNSFASDELVEIAVPAGKVPVTLSGEPVACQRLNDTTILMLAKAVPSLGYQTYLLVDGEPEGVCLTASSDRLENDFFVISLNDKGQFTSLFDKRNGRQLFQNGELGNRLMTYENKPHNYDAWDINHYYQEKSWPVEDLLSAEIVENGAVRTTLQLTYRYEQSTICQYISVYRDLARVDVRNEIDWNEKHLLLKAFFPIDVHTNEATFDIQYGNVTRPTHKNTMWDFARFEVCQHKWMDVSEDDYGFSLLNDCKYGVSVLGSTIGLSMLKSSTYPNPVADQEHHTFTYSLYPHAGSWKQSETPKEAYKLNNPLQAVTKSTQGGELPAAYALAAVTGTNVFIESVKKAEDSNELILRLYECYNRTGTVEVTFGGEILKLAECDMQENELAAIPFDGTKASLSFQPYEIKTVKLCLK